MSIYRERAQAMRNDTQTHCNCAQAVLCAYAPECGISQGKALQLGMHFGSGMKIAATCGAITGGLMVIGMLGGGDDAYRQFMTMMKQGHEGLTDCADLLKKNAERGGNKKEHCDGMVYEAVEAVAAVMKL
jgi:C_GCAxxG_C_C family probable redox protein